MDKNIVNDNGLAQVGAYYKVDQSETMIITVIPNMKSQEMGFYFINYNSVFVF